MKRILLLILAAVMLAAAVIGCQGQTGVPDPTISMPEKARTVLVYFSTGNTLVQEKHVVADSKNIIKTAIDEVLAAKPQENKDIAIVQPECKVLDVKVDKEGVATINFSKEVLDFEATPKEKLLAFGAIQETLKQFKELKAFKFQVQGKENGMVNGKDVKRFWEAVSLIGQPWPLKK